MTITLGSLFDGIGVFPLAVISPEFWKTHKCLSLYSSVRADRICILL